MFEMRLPVTGADRCGHVLQHEMTVTRNIAMASPGAASEPGHQILTMPDAHIDAAAHPGEVQEVHRQARHLCGRMPAKLTDLFAHNSIFGLVDGQTTRGSVRRTVPPIHCAKGQPRSRSSSDNIWGQHFRREPSP